MERELLAPDLDLLELIRNARERGKQVIAVSDTYFSERQLRSLLDPHFAFDTAIDRVFASCEHGTSKMTDLFGLVLQELGREAREVVHVGDNEHADILGARRFGIRGVYFERRPRQLETALEREQRYLELDRVWPHGDEGLTALRAKTLARRELGQLPERLRPFWRYGAAMLGPALAGFAEWVHSDLQARGIATAYCLMREGELLSKLINGAAGYLGSDARAEPLWLSRQVCARASIFEGTPEELDALLSRRLPPTVRELCSTLQIDPERSSLLRAHTEARLGERAFADEVFEELTTNPELRGPMVEQARRLRERVVECVRARVPGGEGQIALVDLGWGGTIQKLLQDILLRERVPIATAGLYLITHDLAARRMVHGVDMAGYLGSCGVPGPGVRSVMRSPEILEQLCMPDVGSQLDLNADLEPVLADPIDSALVQSAERGAAQAGILAFQREWARYAELIPGPIRLVRDDARRLLLAQVARATGVADLLRGRDFRDPGSTTRTSALTAPTRSWAARTPRARCATWTRRR